MSQSRLRILIVTLPLLLGLLVSPALAGTGKTYGEPLTGSKVTAISKLLGDPESYVGQTVRVKGVITGVCEKRGCWVTLASDEEFEELRIKAQDGVIVFPVQAKGKKATAEGVFTKIEMSMEQTLKYEEHHAEEHGEEFDPESVTEPLVYYQVNVIGAVVR
jgi:hypothetical protein